AEAPSGIPSAGGSLGGVSGLRGGHPTAGVDYLADVGTGADRLGAVSAESAVLLVAREVVGQGRRVVAFHPRPRPPRTHSASTPRVPKKTRRPRVLTPGQHQ